MKLLQGKTPAERNKIIAAIILGGLAVLVLSYTFLIPSSSSKPVAKISNVNGNSNTNRAVVSTSPTPNPVLPRDEVPDNSDYLITPVSYSLAGIGAPDASRNIFALFDPSSVPPRAVVVNTPKPEVFVPPSPTPPPVPPPFVLSGVSPQVIYAQTGDFNLSVDGDRFTPESKIYFNGTELRTQFQSPQRLTGVVPANLVSSEGEREVIVRTPDNSGYSNRAGFNVQAPPVPNFTFVGLVARKRFNNDEAKLQNKQTKEYINVRLNELVPDRFRVASISASEVIVVDTQLKLKHRLAYSDDKKPTSYGGSQTGNGGFNNGVNNGFNNGGTGIPNPYGASPQQDIPGIPNNIPRQPQPNNPNDDEDDDQP